ncbi:hypothetical protein BCV69DRAFT_31690 [Microstroma glucosiphilum]|uniref:Uncharacterized protein n=1 Tax=Pseudomicrostroma glucosiphilum TaxID=1684307 RepID=A0A316U5L6_9BASI|nr:hypothetical protein BCV69DRAFT_31690 [Pseudomicrostroma glucosiphilum]PWN19751.1 hypothetical protein BCV69DRAFT_31690 [Pseudomicrostroma glucosiphilum]
MRRSCELSSWIGASSTAGRAQFARRALPSPRLQRHSGNEVGVAWPRLLPLLAASVGPSGCRGIHTAGALRRQTALRDSILDHDPAFAWDAKPSDGFGEETLPRNQVESGLAAMDDGELIDHCRQAAAYGLRGLVDEILAHFEGPYGTAPSASSSSSPKSASRRRRCMEAMTQGSLSRDGSKILISPEQMLRVYQLLRQEYDQSREDHLFAFLSRRSARYLALRLSASKYIYLFDAFREVQEQLLQTNASEQDDAGAFPSRKELIHTLQYCLSEALWQRGGSALVRSSLDQLLSREAERAILVEASDDAKAWLGDEADPDSFFALFTRLFAIRLSIQAGDVGMVARHCHATLTRFASSARSETVALQYAIDTAEALCRISPIRKAPSKTDGFSQSQQILRDFADQLVPAMQSHHQASAIPPLRGLCEKMLQNRRYQILADLLLHYKGLGLRITQLITAFQLTRLARGLVLQRGVSVRQQVIQLTGFPSTESAPNEAELLVLDLPAKRYLLSAFLRLGLKSQSALLWNLWTSNASNDAELLRRDMSTVVDLVKLFADKDPKRQRSFTKGLSAGVLSTKQRDQEFASTALQRFVDAKTGEKYSHFELTSLAVAYLYLGRESEALNAFVQLLHQREIPDETDVIVLLSAVSGDDAEKASQLYLSYVTDTGSEVARSEGLESPFVGLRPTPKIFEHLIGMAFRAQKVTLAHDLVLQACNRLPQKDWTDTILVLQRAFRVKTRYLSWTWPLLVQTITPEVAAKLDASILSRMICCAAERLGPLDPEPGKNSAKSKVVPIATADTVAAIDLLDLATTRTGNIDIKAFHLILDQLHGRARWIERRRGRREQSQPSWIAQLDRVVACIRKADHIHQQRSGDRDRPLPVMADFSPAETSSAWGSATEETTLPSSGRRSGRRTSLLLNQLIFRRILAIYLSLDDISGASQVYLWMKLWDPKTTVGENLRKKLSGMLRSLDILELGTKSPSWTFEGRRIEKTKSWWSVGVPGEEGE